MAHHYNRLRVDDLSDYDLVLIRQIASEIRDDRKMGRHPGASEGVPLSVGRATIDYNKADRVAFVVLESNNALAEIPVPLGPKKRRGRKAPAGKKTAARKKVPAKKTANPGRKAKARGTARGTKSKAGGHASPWNVKTGDERSARWFQTKGAALRDAQALVRVANTHHSAHSAFGGSIDVREGRSAIREYRATPQGTFRLVFNEDKATPHTAGRTRSRMRKADRLRKSTKRAAKRVKPAATHRITSRPRRYYD